MKRTFFAVLLVSSSALMFEVALTRLFSIHLWYHFAFMVISIAMLGTGSAGTLLYMILTGKDALKKSRLLSDNYIASFAVLAGASFLIAYIASNHIPFDPVRISWEPSQFIYLILYCLLLSIPYFFCSMMIAAVLVKYRNNAGTVYGFDLLGAGSGSILVIIVLNIAGPEYAVLIISTICLIGALLIGNKYINCISCTLILVNAVLWIFHPPIIDVHISEYKKLSMALTYPGSAHIKTYHSSYSRIDTFTSPLIRYAPGLSLNYLEPLPEQIGIAIDGDRTEVITHAGHGSEMNFITFLPSSLSYEIATKKRVLVLDPKGGLPLLTARQYGFPTIHGVESNPLLSHVITQDYNEYSGGIYDKNVWTGLGRNFLDKLDGSDHRNVYDLIDIPVENTSVSGIFGITENYKYTSEAFEKYLGSLTTDGILSINLYLTPPPRTELRILSTIINVLHTSAVEKPGQRLAAIRSWDTISILVKNTDFTDMDITLIKKFSQSRRFDLVYYPGIKAEETNIFIKMQSNPYHEQFKTIINQNDDSSYVKNYLFDITPVHDDNPFFHYFLKLRNIYPIYEMMGQNFLFFIEEGYLLPLILIVIILLSSILIISPVIYGRGSSHIASSHFYLTLVLFSMLGMGFMFIEITLIQKSILLIENPALSVSTILATILISSGAGSLFIARYNGKGTISAILMLCLLLILYNFAQPQLFRYLSPHSLTYRVSALMVTLAPLGFLMGIPFPMGLKLIGHINQSLIPWAWAVNACFSVLSPVLAVMLAISTGFYMVTWFAVIAYMVVYFAMKRLLQF